MISAVPEGLTICNSSCLIALDAVGSLDILERLYGTIAVPNAVAQECSGALPAWIQVHFVQNQPLVQSLHLDLGAGEAEAIALAVECSASRIILDDKKARRMAMGLALPVTGTLAVLLKAKERGIVPNVRDILDAMMAKSFRVSAALVRELLQESGE
jgi:predicted nucleic acid-binding protein